MNDYWKEEELKLKKLKEQADADNYNNTWNKLMIPSWCLSTTIVAVSNRYLRKIILDVFKMLSSTWSYKLKVKDREWRQQETSGRVTICQLSNRIRLD